MALTLLAGLRRVVQLYERKSCVLATAAAATVGLSNTAILQSFVCDNQGVQSTRMSHSSDIAVGVGMHSLQRSSLKYTTALQGDRPACIRQHLIQWLRML